MRRIAAMAAGGLLIACLAGCKNSAAPEAPLTTSPGEPKWVSMGAGAFPNDAGKVFYCVGVAPANRFPGDPFMLSKSATDSGQAKIFRQLNTLVAAVFKDYSAAAFTPDVNPAEMRRMAADVQKSVTDAAFAAAKVFDSWKDSQTGDLYVLIKLNMDDVAHQIRSGFMAIEQDKLKLDAAAAHQELDRIIRNAEAGMMIKPK